MTREKRVELIKGHKLPIYLKSEPDADGTRQEFRILGWLDAAGFAGPYSPDEDGHEWTIENCGGAQ